MKSDGEEIQAKRERVIAKLRRQNSHSYCGGVLQSIYSLIPALRIEIGAGYGTQINVMVVAEHFSM